MGVNFYEAKGLCIILHRESCNLEKAVAKSNMVSNERLFASHLGRILMKNLPGVKRRGCLQYGVLYACGKNQQGQLGINSFQEQYQLQPVHNLG